MYAESGGRGRGVIDQEETVEVMKEKYETVLEQTEVLSEEWVKEMGVR